jgi:hypothetical protein
MFKRDGDGRELNMDITAVWRDVSILSHFDRAGKVSLKFSGDKRVNTVVQSISFVLH